MTGSMTEATQAIEKVVQECNIEAIHRLSDMEQTIRLAQGMKELRALLTEQLVVDLFFPLKGSPLGFRTDEGSNGRPKEYHWSVVRDCLIEAFVKGAKPVWNEFNIISERTYFTKEYFERKVAEFDGLTDLRLDAGVPRTSGDGALVPYSAEWWLGGQRHEMVCDYREAKEDEPSSDTRIPVRVNKGMGMDAILGKAKRKFLARVYERLSGISIPEGDVDGDAIDTVGQDMTNAGGLGQPMSKSEEIAERHRSKSRKGRAGDSQQQDREPGED